MRAAKTLVTAISILVLICGVVANAFGVTLTVGNAEVNNSLNNSVTVDVVVDNPSEIAGAAFTVSYDAQALELVAVESDFFAPFVDQFSQLPGAGTPFVNPQDNKTYVPFTVGENTVYIPAEEIIDGVNFTQPVMVGPETATGTSIVAARVVAGEQGNQTLFRLTFDVSAATSGDYDVSIVQTTLNNPEAGYSASGEAVPMLIGALATGADQDLADPAAFPQIAVEAVHNGTITVTNTVTSTDQPAIANKPADPPIVAAGTSSETFTVTGGDDRQYTWTVTDDYGQVTDTHFGNSYTFTAPATGTFAGVYTITATDYQGASDSFAVKVPMTISPSTLSFTEMKLDGTDNPQSFAVTGADGDYTWEILRTRNAGQAVTNPAAYGTWEKSSPVYNDKTNTFFPADIDAWTSFYIRVTVDNNVKLTPANGLNRIVAGPFTLLPVDTYTVILEDGLGAIDGTLLAAGDITVKEVSTDQTKTHVSSNGEVNFLLPDIGGTYQYEVKDTRVPAVYVDQTVSAGTKIVSITLERQGQESISGIVEGSSGFLVPDATVTVYLPENVSVRYQTTTAADGFYHISLPVGSQLSGWTVVVSHPDYISLRQDDQSVGTVDFTGSHSLYTGTVIKNVSSTIVGTTVQLDITVSPAISDLSEIEVDLVEGTGTLSSMELTDNIDRGATVTLTYDVVENFTVAIKADTSEDHNPNVGYRAEKTYVYTRNTSIAAIADVYVGENGGEASLHANGQQASVNVPAGGVTGDISIAIEQFEMNGGTQNSHRYVYYITAYNSTTGEPLSDAEINYLEITLPLDLTLVKPGDLENGIVVIYHAEDYFALEANGGTAVPITDILSTDYIGDGRIGSVTFSVDHLSVFEVSATDAGTGSSASSSDNDTRPFGFLPPCFIATASHNSAQDLYVAILRQLRSVYQRFAE